MLFRSKTKATAKKTTMMTTKATTATRSEHGKPTITFSKLVDKLQQHYGAPAPPPSTDPLELIIWENIAYLANAGVIYFGALLEMARAPLFESWHPILLSNPIHLT